MLCKLYSQMENVADVAYAKSTYFYLQLSNFLGFVRILYNLLHFSLFLYVFCAYFAPILSVKVVVACAKNAN